MDDKTCSRCGETKSQSLYYKSKGTRDGLQSHCKPCDNHRCTLRLRAKSQRDVVAGTKRDQVLTLVAKELRAQGLKRCPGCKVIKPLDGFYEHKNAFDGRAPHCIVCVGTRKKMTKQVISDQQRQANREKVLRRQFGITMAEYQAMHDIQKGLCAICGMPESGKNLAVDHDHATRKVRELLCGRCNPAVGFLRESPELARKLALYLEKHR